MSAPHFIRDLLETGRVRVARDGKPPRGLGEAVDELDRAARVEMAFDAPELSRPAAQWAAETLYHGCRFLAYREIEAEAVREALARPCPEPPSPAVCYSADLTFRYLPDLLALARGIAEGDPLVTGLMALAHQWPLSSVGVAGVGEVDVSPFIGDPTLRRLYADRVIDRRDVSRLKHPPVREAVREALGGYPELAPQVAAAVSSAAGELQTAEKS